MIECRFGIGRETLNGGRVVHKEYAWGKEIKIVRYLNKNAKIVVAKIND